MSCILTSNQYTDFHRLMADHSCHTKKNSKIVQGVDPLYDVDIDDIVHNIDIDYIPDFLYLSIWCKQMDVDMISIHYCQYEHSRN